MSKHEIPIPEGYDVLSSEFHISWNYGTDKEEDVIITRLKKKQKKDFSFYIDQYLDTGGSSTSDEIVNWFEYQQADALKHRLKTNQFSLVPWEIKIGLFRFICDNLDLSWLDEINKIFKEEASVTLEIMFSRLFCNEILPKTK